MTNKEKYTIDPSTESVPDVNLCKFLEGYDTHRDPVFEGKKWILFIPFFGQIVGIFVLIGYLCKKCFLTRHMVYLYEKGVLWRSIPKFGSQKDVVIRYNDVKGIKCAKTRHYQSTYGVKSYSSTSVVLDICDKHGNSLLHKKFSYINEKDNEDKFNALGYAMRSIMDAWHPYAIERFNHEMSETGHGIFFVGDGSEQYTVTVGKDFISANGNSVSSVSGFKYFFSDGDLYLYPSECEKLGRKLDHFTINVNEMYDNIVFYLAISKFLGIN